MDFELGKEYVIKVTEKDGIVPLFEFNRSRFFDKDYDDPDLLSNDERERIINYLLKDIKKKSAEIYKELDSAITYVSNYTTNKEVFKQVFGFDPNTNTCVMSKDCCNGNPAECDGCRFNDWWNAPYKESEKK